MTLTRPAAWPDYVLIHPTSSCVKNRQAQKARILSKRLFQKLKQDTAGTCFTAQGPLSNVLWSSTWGENLRRMDVWTWLSQPLCPSAETATALHTSSTSIQL